jgi:hypothetical protein
MTRDLPAETLFLVQTVFRFQKPEYEDEQNALSGDEFDGSEEEGEAVLEVLIYVLKPPLEQAVVLSEEHPEFGHLSAGLFVVELVYPH